MKLLIAGRPGSGKGTQARRVSRALTVPHISTGELLRDAIRRGTPAGLSARECVAAGRFVPDSLVNELVQRELELRPTGERGFLLDGFPRNLDQLNALCLWLDPEHLDAAIELTVSNDVVIERLATRGRTDDTRAGVRERLRAFANDTAPALEHLASLGLLISIDAEQPADAVTRDILEALGVPGLRAADEAPMAASN